MPFCGAFGWGEMGVTERAPIRAELGEIDRPALITEGKEDLTMVLDILDGMHTAIRGSGLVRVPNRSATSLIGSPCSMSDAAVPILHLSELRFCPKTNPLLA